MEHGRNSLHDDVLVDTEDVTSERPIALMPTLIRKWEAMRASEVMKWQRYRTDWDAILLMDETGELNV